LHFSSSFGQCGGTDEWMVRSDASDVVVSRHARNVLVDTLRPMWSLDGWG